MSVPVEVQMILEAVEAHPKVQELVKQELKAAFDRGYQRGFEDAREAAAQAVQKIQPEEE